jgi:predicted glycoside hydrolase/deacetylase ChbG (UPF0249 family)
MYKFEPSRTNPCSASAPALRPRTRSSARFDPVTISTGTSKVRERIPRSTSSPPVPGRFKSIGEKPRNSPVQSLVLPFLANLYKVARENPMSSSKLLFFGILAVLMVTPLCAQNQTVAERLGYPADSKLLILHADDLGVAHSEDVASFAALDKKAVSSASIMVPCPWLTEVADYAKAHPEADLGLHLTLTSEWKTYRWGPVESKDKVPSLLGPDGTLWLDSPSVAAHVEPQEAEREIRAQIDRAIALGIRPTHLDGHMAAVFSTPKLFARYVKVAHDYHLPFMAVKSLGGNLSELTDKDIVFDSVIIAGPEISSEHWKDFYQEAIENMKPGLTEIIVHLGHDDAELEAVMVDHPAYGAAWRQRDYDIITSAGFQKGLQDHHIIVIRWRDLQKLVN